MGETEKKHQLQLFHYVPLSPGLLKKGNPDAYKLAGVEKYHSEYDYMNCFAFPARGQFQILRLKSKNLSTD